MRGTRTLANILHRSLGGKEDIYGIWKLHSDYTEPVKVAITPGQVAEMQKRARELFPKLKKLKRK